MKREGQHRAEDNLPLFARPAADDDTRPPTAPLLAATPAATQSVTLAAQQSSSAMDSGSSRLDGSSGYVSSDASPAAAGPAAAATAAARKTTVDPTVSSSSNMRSTAASSSSSRFDSSPEHFSSNALDIDQVLPSHHLRNRLPAAQSYRQATAGDNPAPPPGQQQQQQQQQPSNEVAIDDIDFLAFKGALQASRYGSNVAAVRGSVQDVPAGISSTSTSQQQQQQQQRPSLLRRVGRPVDDSMSDFPSAGLELVKHFNLDGIFLEKQEVVTHDVSQPAEPDQQQQQEEAQQQRHSRHLRPSKQQQQQQQQQQEHGTPGLPPPRGARHASSRSGSARKHKQQQQQQLAVPHLQYSQPRPHPLNLKPRHVKTHFKVPTSDGWKLHMIRTQVQGSQPSHHHPVILCPGLGSSGAYSFDLSPNVSLADYLASRGWDVWTCELRGNGMSDKPSLFSSRSRWWTIDDHVEKDVPAILRFVLKETHSRQVHFLGHSMGGMILCGVMARVDTTTAKIRSCISVGSGLYLEESWWRLFERFKPLSHTLWIVPSGTLLRTYSRLMFGPWRIPYIDALYFWPGNVDPHVGRAMMRRNFSNISVGVIQQMVTAFDAKGLLSADKRVVYADPGRLAKVSAPALFLVGDRDRMCPAEGCRKTWQMFGSPEKRFICLGPAAGFSDHYGHFDILMGKKVEKEVFPLIHNFLLQHDSPRARM